MGGSDLHFDLPGKVERILALLAKRYSETGDELLGALILGSRYSIDTETFYDGWDGGQYGHDVVLEAPSGLFERIVDRKDEVESKFRDDLNRCHSVTSESIQAVHIELADDADLTAWKPGSGRNDESTALRPPSDAAALSRLWEAGYFRVFLSHKAEYKAGATGLKRELKKLGFTCFVAHEDIEPNREWLLEIERALHSMEAMLALMTSDFSDSDWTDQEVGVAMGRRVPVVSVDLGRTPYGFIGKYQAVKGGDKDAASLAKEIAELFLANPSTGPRVVEAALSRFERASSYAQAGELFRFLAKIENPPEGFLERIEAAYRDNDQVANAFLVKNGLPRLQDRLRNTEASR